MTSETEPTKAVVTACNMGFIDGAEALLRSVARFHPGVKRYCYVPAEEVEAASQRVGDCAEVLPPPVFVKGVPPQMQINVGRLFVTCPPEDVVAYMDADVLMCRPAPELWEIKDGCVTAIPDSSGQVSDNIPGDDRATFTRMFPETAACKGFNGGVFALRPTEWSDLISRFEQILADGAFTYNYIMDQPMLNALIQPNVRWLPFSFDAHCLFDNRIPRDVRILHFTSSPKPWMDDFPKHEPAYWYWLKYGLPRASRATLFAVALRIAVLTPKRLLGRWRGGGKRGRAET